MAGRDVNWSYGCMKNSVAEQMTTRDVQRVTVIMGLPPAVAEQIKKGLDLLREMERRAELSRTNVKKLREYLEVVDLLQAVQKVDEYQKSLDEPREVQKVDEYQQSLDEPLQNCGKESTDGVKDKRQEPNYKLSHMSMELTDATLSLVGSKLGNQYRQFSLQKLKLTKAEIDICAYPHRDSLPDIAFECLYKWREKRGGQVTYGELAKLLHEFGFSKEVWGVLESPPE